MLKFKLRLTAVILPADWLDCCRDLSFGRPAGFPLWPGLNFAICLNPVFFKVY